MSAVERAWSPIPCADVVAVDRTCLAADDLGFGNSTAMLRFMLLAAGAASGMSKRELGALVADELCEVAAASVDSTQLGSASLCQCHQGRGDTVTLRAFSKLDELFRGPGQFVLVPELQVLVDPRFLVMRLLQRLIQLARRADSSRQSAAERIRLASRAAHMSPDRPPGEVVVSSSRVPRGPDAHRTTSFQVVRDELTLAA